LQELAREDRAIMYCRYIAEEHLSEPSRKRRRKVADLVRMWENYVSRLFVLDDLRESSRETVSRVRCEQWVLDAEHFARCSGGNFCGNRICLRPEHNSRHVGRVAKESRGSQGFPTDATHTARALFHNNQNSAHRTCASVLSFSTNVSAASLGEPAII
jgi:hypothetical protein